MRSTDFVNWPNLPVSRIEATSPALSMSLTLDINSDIFPLVQGDRITVCIASSLFGSAPAAGGMDGEEEEGGVARREAWRGGDEGLASEFDYVVYGKVRLNFAPLHLGLVMGCDAGWGQEGFPSKVGLPYHRTRSASGLSARSRSPEQATLSGRRVGSQA